MTYLAEFAYVQRLMGFFRKNTKLTKAQFDALPEDLRSLIGVHQQALMIFKARCDADPTDSNIKEVSSETERLKQCRIERARSLGVTGYRGQMYYP